jgi:hypothetical protein
MRLVWSQPSAPQGRARSLLLVSVICIFLGGVVFGRLGIGDGPRPVRAAAASLLLTGGLLFIVGVAGLILRRASRSSARLSLAPPLPSDPHPLSSFQEEEQR